MKLRPFVRAALSAILMALPVLWPAKAHAQSNTTPVIAQLASQADDAFAGWRAQTARSALTANDLATGLRLAQDRAAAMQQLIAVDPEEFVRVAIPESERVTLPPAIQPWIERRLKGRGDFGVYCVLPQANGTAPTGHGAGFAREVILAGTVFKAHVFGRWLDQTSARNVAIEGVALGDAIAIGDAPAPDEQERGGDPISLAPSTSGANTLLYLIARFSDQGSDPISSSTALSQMTVVSNFWMNNSSGTVSIRGLVNTNQPMDVIFITLPHPSSYASTYNNNFNQLLSDARDAASAQGYNYANYNLDVTVTTSPGFGYAGRAFVGSQGAHLVAGYTTLRTAGHELGHNLGLWHANYWRTDSPVPFGKDLVPGGYCADTSNAEWVEYGHYFSVMSAQTGSETDDATKPHYAAAEKVLLGWLSGPATQYVNSSGTYRIYRHDHRFATNNPRAIRIQTAATDYTGNARRYWLNYRYAPWATAQNWIRNGLQIDVSKNSYGTDGASMLDMTPFSSDAATPFFDPANKPNNWWTIDNSDKLDSALVIGRTYSDHAAGIHITPIATGNSGANQEYIDLVVNLGSSPGNQPPVIAAFTASTNQVATGQNATFNVTASDPNDDTLAYAWDFDEVQVWTASGLNSNAAVKNWSSAGQYRVTVTVSDTKGAVASDTILVTVGSPSANRLITGRVLWGGIPVLGARVFSTNVTSVQAFTDGDGAYVLDGLSSASSYFLLCRANGLTFTAQFANPVSVATANVFGKDFYANETFSAPSSNHMVVAPYEAHVTNGYTLDFDADAWNALGSPTNFATTWSVSGGGFIDGSGIFSATNVGGPFQVIATTGSLAATGTVTVLTAPPPLVSIQAVDATAAEAGADPATFRISRTGSTNSALSVSLTVSGSAIFPSDYAVSNAITYTSSSATLTIPAGQTNANLVLTPVDDSIDETNETIVLTVVDTADYNLGAPSAATATVTDDETQTFVLSTNLLIVPEADSASFAVQLAFQPATNVTVTTFRTNGDPSLTVSAGATLSFTTNNWDTPQTVTIAAAEDLDAVEGSASFVVSAFGAVSQTLTAMEVENDVQFLIVSTNEIVVAEGSTNSFTVRLNAQPTNTLTVATAHDAGDTNLAVASGATLNFTTNDWNTPQTVSLSAAEDDDILAGSATFVISAAGMTNVSIASSELDNDSVALTLSTNQLFVTEGGTNTLTVWLVAQPTNDVVVSAAFESGDTNLSLADASPLTFTPANWNAPQAFAVAAADDDDAVAGSASLVLSAPDLTNLTFIATESENDFLAIAFSTNELSVSEGGTNSLAVWLTAQPTNDLIVGTAFTSGDADCLVVEGGALTFTPTNWSTPQTIAIAAVEDADAATGIATFTASATGLTNATFSAVESDNDTLAIAVSTNDLLVAEGGTNTFTVWLTAQPVNDLAATVAFDSGDTNLFVASGATLTFTPTNWSTPQTVTLNAGEDSDIVAGSASFVISATGAANAIVTATESDNDTVELLLSTNLVLVAENSTNHVAIQLTAQPTNDFLVTVAFVSGDTNLALAEGAALYLTPTNWNVPQTIAISAAEDDDALPGSADFVVAAAGLSNVMFTAVEVENDALTLIVSTNGLAVPEGGSNTIALVLGAQPTNDLTVTTAFDSGDSDLAIADGATIVFTPTNWNMPQSIAISAGEDSDAAQGSTVFLASGAGLPDLLITAIEAENDSLLIAVSSEALSVAEGGTNNFTVWLTAQPTNEVVVFTTFSSGDADLAVAGGAALTFTPTNWAQPQVVWLIAAEDVDVASGTATFTLSAAGLTNLFITATEVDNDTLALLVSTNELNVAEGSTNGLSIWLTAQPANDLVVNTAFDSGDTNLSVVAGEQITFSPTNWNVPATVSFAAGTDADFTNGVAWFIVSSPGLSNVLLTISEMDSTPAPAPVIVTVEATVTNAFEWGGAPAEFTLHRTGDTNSPLTVLFDLGGTASNSVDFATLTNSLEIAAGSNRLSVLVVPLPDALAEGDEALTITLLPDAAYMLTNASVASVTIKDRPIDDWRHAHFTSSELLDPSISGDGADPDADGIVNLLEYAFSLDPKTADVTGAPVGELVAEHLTLTYRESKQAVDLNFAVEAQDAIAAGLWSNAGISETDRLDLGNFWRVTAEDALSVTNASQRFMRLKVTRL